MGKPKQKSSDGLEVHSCNEHLETNLVSRPENEGKNKTIIYESELNLQKRSFH